jgi:hypothetical protein
MRPFLFKLVGIKHILQAKTFPEARLSESQLNLKTASGKVQHSENPIVFFQAQTKTVKGLYFPLRRRR